MAILPIITAPDPRLKRLAVPVETVDEEVCQLIDNMLETMYAAPGVGLAAPQVGILTRVIVVDVSTVEEKRQPLCMVNPEIIWASAEKSVFEEGCLSLPEHFSEVERAERVTVRYLTYENEQCDEELNGFSSICVQHEIDHLNGILFVDHISSLKRAMILRKLKKQQKANVKS
tara:strand:+ start:154 stop:672 length:519 start_codon:yes stop_codon:yes gene_type:complete